MSGLLGGARSGPPGPHPRRRRALAPALAAALALAGAADAFAVGRLALPRGGSVRGRCSAGAAPPSRAGEEARRSGGAEASTHSLPGWAAAAAALCLLAVTAAPSLWAPARAEGPPPAAAQDSVQIVGEDGSVLGEDTVSATPAPDAPRVRKGFERKEAPVIPEEERQRRRNSPSALVADEIWYKRGKIVFVAKCSGCHPAGINTVQNSKSLFWDDLERNGYRDFEKFKYIIRYGKGKMPGYGEDCASVVDFTRCGVISTLDEETLTDLEDFTLNRANAGWKGRG